MENKGILVPSAASKLQRVLLKIPARGLYSDAYPLALSTGDVTDVTTLFYFSRVHLKVGLNCYRKMIKRKRILKQ